jgi:hypothetical protein
VNRNGPDRDGPAPLHTIRRATGRIVLLLLLVPALAVADGNQAESESGDDGERPGWAQRLYDYSGPPEYKVFEVAGHRFRVPYEYAIGSSESDDHFQIVPYWPTLDPYGSDKPQPRHRADFDTLQVTVAPFEDHERRFDLINSRIARAKSALSDGESSVSRVRSLVRVQGTQVYVLLDPVVLGKIKQPVQIVCISNGCRISYMPFTRTEVEIQFQKTLLPQWRTVVQRITQLLNKYRER